jgi:hypothetical protein
MSQKQLKLRIPAFHAARKCSECRGVYRPKSGIQTTCGAKCATARKVRLQETRRRRAGVKPGWSTERGYSTRRGAGG